MRQKILRTVFLVIITFAIFGLLTNLIVNPKSLLTTLLIGLGISFIIYLVLQLFLNKKNGNSTNEMKKYKAAVKQSKQKYSKEPVISESFKVIKKSRRKKQPSHLKVIEGKKSNNK